MSGLGSEMQRKREQRSWEAARAVVAFLCCCVLSPTLTVISRLSRDRNANARRTLLHCWRLVFLTSSLVFVVLSNFAKPTPLTWPPGHLSGIVGYSLLWILPVSRINEIVWAFYNDALDQLSGTTSKTALSPVDRLKAVAHSYVEVASDFAIIYFFLPQGMFCKYFTSIMQAVYFSWVTITTTGYGDITPQRPMSQLLCMYEVAVGLVLIVFGVASYISTVGAPPHSPDEVA